MIAIASEKLSARINPLGAELSSLRDGGERELMTEADPAFWTGRAPILFPVVGRLADDRYRLGEATHAMPKHGFARRMAFKLVRHDAVSALLRLEDDAETRAAYPFAFALDMTFALEGATLATTATVHNRDTRAMPFSFGYHPAFAWPLPYGQAKEAHGIVFERDEPHPVRAVSRVADGLIDPAPQPSPVDGNRLALRHELFAHDALIWDRLESRSVTYGAPGAPMLRIDFPDTPWLGIWQKPGARYICIEPWAGMADPEGFAGDIADKPGITWLEPGASRSFRMDVTLVGG